jgi:hypothetical protein
VRVALVLRGRFWHFLDHGAERGEHAIKCVPAYPFSSSSEVLGTYFRQF